ncbi:MAG: GntR family transcriptional regulator [Syntrophobacteraceae bacterium]
MPIDENVPLYFKIYQELKLSIISGDFEKGSKIDGIRGLAKTYGVASETMNRALRLLQLEGSLVKKKGIGSIIPESVDLRPLEFGKLMVAKKVLETFLESKIRIDFAEWVTPSYRFAQLYGLGQELAQSRIYKVLHKHEFGEKYCRGVKGLMIHYFSEDMYRHLGGRKNVKTHELLRRLCEWLDTAHYKLTETIQPVLCVNNNAELIGLPDGTPTFYQEFFMQGTKGNSGQAHLYTFISNANILTHQMESDENGARSTGL